ncbi:hypothetical protein BL72_06130 [Bifidobacterium longum subsp. longum 72B]|nr:hypothetical protein BL72_06130 [Bifidobacterium longum subsp. longum 72B]
MRRWHGQDFGCRRVELVAAMPRADRPRGRRTRARRVPHRQLDERRARQSQETPVGPGAPRRGREIRQTHARRQIRRVEEPRQADRQTVRGVREPAGHGPQGPALPFMAAQGTPPDAAQTTGDQARTELNRRVFRASHSRIPEIVEPARKIRRHGPDILRTTELGCSNARLEASDNRIKVTIRMAYGFHHVNNLIALIMLRCGGLDIRPPQPRT